MIIFSDAHYYNNPSKSYITGDGISSWLLRQIEVTHEIFSYARRNNVETIIHNGDLFEEKNNINIKIYNTVWQLYNSFSKNFEVILNTGNHDKLTKLDSSLRPFSKIARVITEPTNIDNIRIIPNSMIQDNLSHDNQNILFIHEDIAGLVYGSSQYKSGSKLKPAIFGDWDIVFDGDIHKPQQLGNITVIGSPMIQDWGEAHEIKRFIHFKDNKIISVPIESGPRFYEREELNDKVREEVEEDTKNYYRINISSAELSDSIFKKFNVSPFISKTRKREVRLKQTTKIPLKEYIRLKKPKLDLEKLLKIGEELIHDSSQT